MATRYYNDSTGNDSKSRHTKSILLLAAVGFLLYPAVGCTMATGLGRTLGQHQCLDDFLISYRNQAWAVKAWQCRKARFCNQKYIKDFEKGFRAGYETVAQGGNGCTPGICPQSYWGWQYQAADGQCRMNAWFEAFPLGVQAAEQDGIGNWGTVRTAMPMMPPPNMSMYGTAGAMGAAGGAAGPAVGGLSDQAEPVLAPKPDPAANSTAIDGPANAAKSTAKPKSPAKANVKVAEPKPLTDPKAVEPKSAVPMALEKLAPQMPLPKNPLPTGANTAPLLPGTAPKTEPVVPQPNADPFGFN